MRMRIATVALAVLGSSALTACGAAAYTAGASAASSSTAAASSSTAAAAGYAGYGSAAATPVSRTSTTATAARATTVRLAKTSDGKILVDSGGFTLYLFTADKHGTDRCIHVSGCAAVWPPLTVSGKPSAGSGVNSRLLGTISIGGGRHQVTYDGHPLYTYTGDGSPGATDYVGATSFGGTWWAVNASGSAVH